MELSFKELRKRELLKKGTWFELPVIAGRSVTLRSNETGVDKDQTFTLNEGRYLVQYAGETLLGELLFKGKMFPDPLGLIGGKGYIQATKSLDKVCGLLARPEYGVQAKSINAEIFEELPNYLQHGEYWLASTVKGTQNHLAILVARDRKIYEFSLRHSGCDEMGAYKYVTPEVHFSIDNSHIRVEFNENCNGKSRESAYKIIFVEGAETEEEKEAEEDIFNEETLFQLIASLESEIKCMKKATRHAEIILSGFKEMLKDKK